MLRAAFIIQYENLLQTGLCRIESHKQEFLVLGPWHARKDTHCRTQAARDTLLSVDQWIVTSAWQGEPGESPEICRARLSTRFDICPGRRA